MHDFHLLHRIRQHLLPIVIVLLLALMTALFALGFRPGPGLTVVRTGTMRIENLPPGSLVYVDELRRGAAGTDGVKSLQLVPGNHNIIVDSFGSYPWNNLVHIDARTTTVVNPVLVKSTPRKSLVTDTTAAEAEIKAYALPTTTTLPIEGGCASLSVSNNRIVVAPPSTPQGACPTPYYLCTEGACSATVSLAPRGTLRSVFPYPGNDAYLIVSYGDTVAVVEADPLSPQTFAPLYEGTSPIAVPWHTGSILVQDGKNYYEVTL